MNLRPGDPTQATTADPSLLPPQETTPALTLLSGPDVRLIASALELYLDSVGGAFSGPQGERAAEILDEIGRHFPE